MGEETLKGPQASLSAAPARAHAAPVRPAADVAPSTAAEPTGRVVRPRLAAIGAIGGLLSGLLGVGGGIIMVPLLTLWAGISQRLAHAMSLAAIIPISVAGVATYGGAGKIDVVHAAALTVGSMVGARRGAGLLATADERLLKLAFGSFLTLVAVIMVVQP